MPIYEYECSQCGATKEVLQKFSDKPLVKCDKCSGKLQKIISHSSFHLKGTGWYVTDYSNKSKASTSSCSSKSGLKGETSTTSTDKTADKTTQSSDNDS